MEKARLYYDSKGNTLNIWFNVETFLELLRDPDGDKRGSVQYEQ